MSSSFRRTKTPRIPRISISGICGFLLLLAAPLHAQRKNDFAASIDFMGGVSNQVGSSYTEQGVVANYSVYPSLSLKSSGEHSTFDLNYTFGLDRFEVSPGISMNSHAATAGFTAQPSKGVRLRLTNTFLTTSDFSTINLLKGFYITPEGFQYVFEPQRYQRTTISDNAAGALEIDLNEKSYLTFAGSGSYMHYTGDTLSSGYLYDQTRWEGGLSYSRRLSSRRTLNAKYSVYQNDFQDLLKIRSHAITLGWAQELSPSLNLNIELGPSFTEKAASQKAYLGYVASVYVIKQLHYNRFSFNYARRSGDSTGFGSSSDSHSGGIGFSRTLTRTMTLGFDASAFTQTQRSGIADDYWGYRASVTLSRDLGRHWVASIGGSYQSYQGQVSGPYDLAYKRAFISLGYRLPGLRRESR